MTDENTHLPPSSNGSQDLIDHEDLIDRFCGAIDKAHDISTKGIDDMIVRLENLKKGLEVKKVYAQDNLRDLINSIGQSLSTLQELDTRIKGIEDKHL